MGQVQTCVCRPELLANNSQPRTNEQRETKPVWVSGKPIWEACLGSLSRLGVLFESTRAQKRQWAGSSSFLPTPLLQSKRDMTTLPRQSPSPDKQSSSPMCRCQASMTAMPVFRELHVVIRHLVLDGTWSSSLCRSRISRGPGKKARFGSLRQTKPGGSCHAALSGAQTLSAYPPDLDV